MPATTIDIRPIAGALGAELHGIDLARLDDDMFAAIHDALLRHCVVFFRDQDITPEEQVAFARRFGDIHYHPYIAGMPNHPEIIEVLKTEADTYNFGNDWHTDQMFNPQPAMVTMLYAKEVPPAGGDTLFANMYAAHDALSAGMRMMLDGVRAVAAGDSGKNKRDGRTRRERYASNSNVAMKEPVDLPAEVEHPLFRTHPETGRKSLYIGSHTQRLAGMKDEETDALIRYLRQHAVRPEFTCRFRWEAGSLALWDNRCVQHYAINDYQRYRRRAHRITVKGDTPF